MSVTEKTSKQQARAKLARAAAERAVTQRQNIANLAEFMSEVSKAEGVDAWLDAQLQKVRMEATRRRRRHDVAAGKALAAVVARGESVASIAEQLEISQAKVREYLKLAESANGPDGGVQKLNGAEHGGRD